MSSFSQACHAARARSLAVFGDSITEGAAASAPDCRWANRLAAEIGVVRLLNRGIGGTVLQASPLADGNPRPGNGRGRFAADLLGADRADALAVLYGFNDARYAAAPGTFNLERFIGDYREVLAGLFAGGYAPGAICLGSPPYLPDIGLQTGSTGFTGQSRQKFQAFVGAVKSLAGEAGTFYAAVNERMTEEGSEALISGDHIHPNDRGHAVIAASFAEARRQG